MGCSLKSSHVQRTFTEKQKDYLNSKFRIGETTGQEADAASVAKSMMTAKLDSNGNRLFTSSEFPTARKFQVSFQHTLENDEMTECDIEESQDVEDEEAFRKLRSEILQEVALRHPICYDSYNICELLADSKLSRFAIQMLQDICEHFDILITDIKVKRKAPYIERLMAFARKCTSQRKV